MRTINTPAWDITTGDGPLIAAAIHEGKAVRDDILPLLAISEADRLREQDPYTGEWTFITTTRIVGRRSRFEFDLNRPRDKAVYRTSADCWGLEVWNAGPPDEVVEASLVLYDAFYAEVERLLQEAVDRHGHVVVYDLHSYNYRRGGPGADPADPETHPEVNLGTRTMNRERWSTIVDRFLIDLSEFDFLGRHLDVRENVKFFGGNFPRWIHERFPGSVCVLSVEFKKFFMDEWTGQLDSVQADAIYGALMSTVPGILEELEKL